jgi:spore maturation protein SpmA
MLNTVWLLLLLLSFVSGAFNQTLEHVSKASIDSAQNAVTLALGLVGTMAFWLGLMRVLELAGVTEKLGLWLQPLLRKLFPEIPANHPSLGLMSLTFAANILGLANAATPFGLKTMQSLQTLNPEKHTITHPMVLFLAINTSGFVLFPTGIIALRASLGSQQAGSIIATTWFTSACTLCLAVLCALLLKHLSPSPTACTPKNLMDAEEKPVSKQSYTPPLNAWAFIATCMLAFGYAYTKSVHTSGWIQATHTALSSWFVLLLIAAIVSVGLWKKIPLYETLVEGGKEGFQTALKIIPYLVVVLVAIGMFRASGGLQTMVDLLSPCALFLGIPPETLPMALVRPLSGSGAYAVAAETMRIHGTDTLIGTVVSTLQGNETTFYVLALYTGSVNIQKIRYTLVPCLLADLASLPIAAYACKHFLHHP